MRGSLVFGARALGLSVILILVSGVSGCSGGSDAPGTGGSDEHDAAERDASGGSANDLDAAPAADGGVADAALDAAAPGLLDTLGTLGIDTDLPQGPAAANGSMLPKGYHPLRKALTTLDQRDELFYFRNQNSEVRAYDDAVNTTDLPARLDYTSSSSTASTGFAAAALQTAVAADIDGDGVDEVVVVYYDAPATTIWLYTIDRNDKGAFVTSDPIAVDTAVKTVTYDNWIESSVAGANLDDDPAEELVIGFGKLYMLDDADSKGTKFAPITPLEDPGAEHVLAIDAPRITVSVGDLDGAPGDQTDEIVVTHDTNAIGRIEIFDGKTHVRSIDATFIQNVAGLPLFSYHELRAAVGNFDPSDPEDEIAFVGWRREDNDWWFAMMDGKSYNYSWYRGIATFINDADGHINYDIRRVDVDGDRTDEIFVDAQLFSKFDGAPSASDALVDDTSAAFDSTSVLVHPAIPIAGQYGRLRGGRAGNLVRTHAPTAGQTRAPIEDELVGIDEDTGTLVYGAMINGTFGWHTIDGVGGGADDTIVLGNFDKDSPIVRYQGQHELLFSEPQPIALLSAPPFYAEKSGIDQPTDNTYTAFGKSSSKGAVASQSMGLSVGWSIGYEADYAFGLAKVESTISFEQQFDSTATQGHELTQAITYASGPENSVVFSAVPFDVYYYEIEASPTKADIGKTITVNMPRTPQTAIVSADFYDLNRGDTPEVGKLFTHDVGDPHSYPSKKSVDALCGKSDVCYQSDAATVGEGSGFTELYIAETESMSAEQKYDFSVTSETKIGIGGVTFGRSVGFSYGFGMTATTTNSTQFTGRVSDIQDRTAKDTYSFGLNAYVQPFSSDKQRRVMLVDYWVQ